MVKMGFIVEGDTEKILLESQDFKNVITELKADYIPEIINAEGNGNLLPKNIQKYISILLAKGATKIIVLTDLDNDSCVTETKNRINLHSDQICIVSKKKIESWFLADTEALKIFIASNITVFENPEDIENPFDEIKRLKITKIGRGFVNSKRYLANAMVANGFSIIKAASHPNCSSAKYFINKLTELSDQN